MSLTNTEQTQSDSAKPDQTQSAPLFTRSVEDVSQQFDTDAQLGLSQAEAEQRLTKYGPNQLSETHGVAIIPLFLRQLKNPLLIVLFFGALLSFYIQHYVDAFAITAIILINATISFMQEFKAQRSMDALREMAAPKCWVKRDGEWQNLAAADLVPGDLIKLETGTIIPADARLVETVQIQIDESALTGESDPVRKNAKPLSDANLILADQINMCFMSTSVIHGYATAIVTGTGMNTEVGHIAELMESGEQRLTPLQLRIKNMSHILILAALVIVAIIMAMGFFQGMNLSNMSSIGISLAVAAIPEGLPTVVTIVLTMGAYQMMRSNALAKHLTSVETLGSTTVICSDKTGTLTQNKMQVQKIWLGGESLRVDGVGYEPKGQFYNDDGQPIEAHTHKPLMKMLKMSALCSDTRLVETDGQYSIHGLPTEGAIVVAAAKAKVTKEQLLNDYDIEHSFPFDSSRKMMSVIVRDEDNQAWLYVKGAPDVIMSRCDYMVRQGETVNFSGYQKDAHEVTSEFGRQALRTLAIAFRKLSEEDLESPDTTLETQLTLKGIYGIIDPPRPEATQAVKDCHSAGIGVVMITGDHVETAKAIALQMHIIDNANSSSLTGAELNELDDQQLYDCVKNIRVFARVTPEHKLRIVHALQSHQEVVAMTGDGVNDAPALRAADIGVAMGISGTGVAKESADLILLDDNFKTIVTAVREGRRIYDNIRKFIRQALTANVSEVSALLFAFVLISATVDESGNMLVMLTLAPLMILWVNLVSDGIPALALGVDGAENDVMKRQPRASNESFFADHLSHRIVIRGLAMGALTYGVFISAINQDYSSEYAQTLAFMTLIFGQLFHIFDARTFTTIYQRNPFSNPALLWAVAGSAALSISMVYWSWGQTVLGTTAVALEHLLIVIALSALPTLILSGIKQLFKVKWL
ncbi:MAG: cation-translocating P-type ATPase [Thiomicrospira sp.]|uniref:cation-translocating P-type ATPase n=1 Tax=Thiomicrospira sp. TaxID=935 RepID=UPI001A03ADCB|nr:cation-translocating P-type ATPase [Thiomicrospira sp.]MBE0493186.1 cation-translocating P-type ATPase [Thiomicrospira sp.]